MKLLLLRSHRLLDKFYFPGYLNESLGILSLAAFVKPLCEVRLIDSLAEGWNHYWLDKSNPSRIYQGLKPDKLLKMIEKFNPEVVGITWIFSSDNEPIKDLIFKIKKFFPETKIIVGGPVPSANPRQILEKYSKIDLVVFGEGELTLKELILKEFKNLEDILGIAYREKGQIIINLPRPRIQNLDDFPLPARELLPPINYSKLYFFKFIFNNFSRLKLPFQISYFLAFYLSKLPLSKFYYFIYNKKHRYTFLPQADIVTARGCPNHCAFCAIHNVWGHRWIARSAENVLKEIDFLVKNFKIKHINIQDDNFNILKERTIAVCKGIIKRGYKITLNINSGVYLPTLDEEVLSWLKRAGANFMRFSVESGNAEVLEKIINKKINLAMVKPVVDICKKLKIKTEGAFIFGIPGQTIKAMKDSLEFAERCGFDVIKKFIYQPFPNTELYRICEEKKYFTEDFDPENLYIKGSKCYLKTEDFSPEDVLNIARS